MHTFPNPNIKALIRISNIVCIECVATFLKRIPKMKSALLIESIETSKRLRENAGSEWNVSFSVSPLSDDSRILLPPPYLRRGTMFLRRFPLRALLLKIFVIALEEKRGMNLIISRLRMLFCFID
ncbi:hypothetical protein CEXT_246251 [Caerostris extrusa]|uniref:Uncharacterized protein n=1 Tax=Caerostris extrusa TaxID=172846 RepID=A0AAV4RAW0_CAEEX|nr:hypothetical protein CEXT_246251 [Caerostris extrusa]